MSIELRKLNMLELAARAIVPSGVMVSVSSVKNTVEPLWPGEIDAVADAVPSRVSEFTAGRTAARRALIALGRPPSAIPAGKDRAPNWPRATVGSIAHDETACIAIVAERERFRALGVDVEPAQPIEAELYQEICRPEERAWLRQLPFKCRGLAARRFFCAKESVYKCQYTVSREIFGFEALSVNFDKEGRFQARLTRTAGPFGAGTIFNGVTALVSGQILSLCWIAEEGDKDAEFLNSVIG